MAVDTTPLMPKATAVWLIDNTTLTFEQIADFCGLHPLEVKGIADEDVAKGIKGQDPVTSGQLTRDAIEAAEKDPAKRLKMATPKHKMPAVKLKKAPRYTPVSKRQDKPDAVYWILRNHPEFTDPDIIKLIGTTKSTIQKIRERSHWNATNIKAVDPVTLGLCSQLELDLAVTRANQRKDRVVKKAVKRGESLRPISETVGSLSDDHHEDEHHEAEAESPEPAEAESPEPAEAEAPESATDNPDEGAPASDDYNLSSELEQD